MIDQLAQFTGIRAAEMFVEPLQLRLGRSSLLKQLGFFGQVFLLVLVLLASGEDLNGAIEKLPLPLAHLDRVDGGISGDLLDRLKTAYRLHDNWGFEVGADGAALAN